jgi:flagellar protein FliS
VQSSSARDHYFFTDVKTATPQRLQLLLIEGALRLANRAGQLWQQGRNDLALQSLLDAQAIVAQILAAIDHEAGGDVAKRVSALYEFIYRSLVKAGHRRDAKGLADAIRILEIERETWRQLCDKLAVNAPYATFGSVPPGVVPVESRDPDLMTQAGGFSIEA